MLDRLQSEIRIDRTTFKHCSCECMLVWMWPWLLYWVFRRFGLKNLLNGRMQIGRDHFNPCVTVSDHPLFRYQFISYASNCDYPNMALMKSERDNLSFSFFFVFLRWTLQISLAEPALPYTWFGSQRWLTVSRPAYFLRKRSWLTCKQDQWRISFDSFFP